MIGLVIILALAVPSQQITWEQSAQSISTAQAYLYKLYIYEESGKKTTVVLTNTLCGANNGIIECSAQLPAAGQPAIITGNQSFLSATDTNLGIESDPSLPIKGDQGCILRNNLYAIGTRASLTANKPGLNALLNEFKAAKFKLISTTPKGGQFVVTEECVGYIVN